MGDRPTPAEIEALRLGRDNLAEKVGPLARELAERNERNRALQAELAAAQERIAAITHDYVQGRERNTCAVCGWEPGHEIHPHTPGARKDG